MKLPPYLADADGYCYPATGPLARAQGLTPWYGQVNANGYRIPGTEPPPPWLGQTVVCVASGPSLTQQDCERVAEAGLATVVVNDSWRRAPFADVLFATDHGWWQQHTHEITTAAARWTDSVPAAQEFDLHLFIAPGGRDNSGARAIDLAISRGAQRVLLLGYDCSLHRGSHWHGDHTRTGNPDQGAVERWIAQFEQLAQTAQARGVEVINCSRETRLGCFARQELGKALDSVKKMAAVCVP